MFSTATLPAVTPTWLRQVDSQLETCAVLRQLTLLFPFVRLAISICALGRAISCLRALFFAATNSASVAACSVFDGTTTDVTLALSSSATTSLNFTRIDPLQLNSSVTRISSSLTSYIVRGPADPSQVRTFTKTLQKTWINSHFLQYPAIIRLQPNNVPFPVDLTAKPVFRSGKSCGAGASTQSVTWSWISNPWSYYDVVLTCPQEYPLFNKKKNK